MMVPRPEATVFAGSREQKQGLLVRPSARSSFRSPARRSASPPMPPPACPPVRHRAGVCRGVPLRICCKSHWFCMFFFQSACLTPGPPGSASEPPETSRWSLIAPHGPPDGASETPKDLQMEPKRPSGTPDEVFFLVADSLPGPWRSRKPQRSPRDLQMKPHKPPGGLTRFSEAFKNGAQNRELRAQPKIGRFAIAM